MGRGPAAIFAEIKHVVLYIIGTPPLSSVSPGRARLTTARLMHQATWTYHRVPWSLRVVTTTLKALDTSQQSQRQRRCSTRTEPVSHCSSVGSRLAAAFPRPIYSPLSEMSIPGSCSPRSTRTRRRTRPERTPCAAWTGRARKAHPISATPITVQSACGSTTAHVRSAELYLYTVLPRVLSSCCAAAAADNPNGSYVHSHLIWAALQQWLAHKHNPGTCAAAWDDSLYPSNPDTSIAFPRMTGAKPAIPFEWPGPEGRKRKDVAHRFVSRLVMQQQRVAP